jgi:hypothetical protein
MLIRSAKEKCLIKTAIGGGARAAIAPFLELNLCPRRPHRFSDSGVTQPGLHLPLPRQSMRALMYGTD